MRKLLLLLMSGTKQKSTMETENRIHQLVSVEVKCLRMSNPTFCFFAMRSFYLIVAKKKLSFPHLKHKVGKTLF